MTAHDYWFDRAEAEANGAPAIVERSLEKRRDRRRAEAVILRGEGWTVREVADWTGLTPQAVAGAGGRQLRATGATSGPRSSSGSKEGRGQL